MNVAAHDQADASLRDYLHALGLEEWDVKPKHEPGCECDEAHWGPHQVIAVQEAGGILVDYLVEVDGEHFHYHGPPRRLGSARDEERARP